MAKKVVGKTYIVYDARTTTTSLADALILLAASGKFESERLCSYNKGATWGDVGC